LVSNGSAFVSALEAIVVSEAYYDLLDSDDPLGERFSASAYTGSAWSPGSQNAAPPSALLVRAIERCAPRADSRIARVVIDVLGPVPLSDGLWTRARVERKGTKIELLVADLLAHGPNGRPRVAARATAWRFQHYDTASVVWSAEPALAPLSEARPADLGRPSNDAYVRSLDWRWINDAQQGIPGECWVKPVIDLVRGEKMTPMQQLFSVADIANGMGMRLSMGEWLFQNTDLAVHVHRVPQGQWIGVRANNHFGPDGVGVSVGTLFDVHGPIANVQQAQLLRRRSR
jgi:acyl-Coa thioesterase superfamily protein/acyl-CoA thioesterase superfamily protein